MKNSSVRHRILKPALIWILGTLVWTPLAGAQVTLPDWENPSVFEVNQVPPHTPLAPFDKLEDAIRTPFKQSPYVLLLNGQWKFNWAPIPEDSPADFYLPGYDVTAWRTIQGYEMMNMIRKGQIVGAEKGNIRAQNQFIAELFGLVV